MKGRKLKEGMYVIHSKCLKKTKNHKKSGAHSPLKVIAIQWPFVIFEWSQRNQMPALAIGPEGPQVMQAGSTSKQRIVLNVRGHEFVEVSEAFVEQLNATGYGQEPDWLHEDK